MNLYEELLRISKESKNKEDGKNDVESDIYKKFSLSSISGKRFYKNLSDEQLIHVIIDISKEIGHSPSQKETYWVWREYIKLRFKKWPYALVAAGLPKNAGMTLEQAQASKRIHDQVIVMIREKAKALGRIPHPKDLPDVCIELGKYMGKWQCVIEEAELNQEFFLKYSLYKIDDLEEEYHQYLQDIYHDAYRLGRAPLRNETDSVVRAKLVNRCGSWRNALYQIGLEPVTRIKPFSSTYVDYRCNKAKHYHQNTLFDCYYKVLNLDKQSINDLVYLKKIATKLGRLPNKKEVPIEIRLRLQKKCGSWVNTLNQIQYVDDGNQI